MTPNPRETNPDHAADRPHGFTIKGDRMIGRLSASEFDLLDAIVVNGRITNLPGILIGPLGRTLRLHPNSLVRRMYRMKEIGLVEEVAVDLTRVGSDSYSRVHSVFAYRLTPLATRLFNEALELMDRGLVAA